MTRKQGVLKFSESQVERRRPERRALFLAEISRLSCRHRSDSLVLLPGADSVSRSVATSRDRWEEKLSVESEKGGGSTFTLSLPLAPLRKAAP